MIFKEAGYVNDFIITHMKAVFEDVDENIVNKVFLDDLNKSVLANHPTSFSYGEHEVLYEIEKRRGETEFKIKLNKKSEIYEETENKSYTFTEKNMKNGVK